MHASVQQERAVCAIETVRSGCMIWLHERVGHFDQKSPTRDASRSFARQLRSPQCQLNHSIYQIIYRICLDMNGFLKYAFIATRNYFTIRDAQDKARVGKFITNSALIILSFVAIQQFNKRVAAIRRAEEECKQMFESRVI